MCYHEIHDFKKKNWISFVGLGYHYQRIPRNSKIQKNSICNKIAKIMDKDSETFMLFNFYLKILARWHSTDKNLIITHQSAREHRTFTRTEWRIVHQLFVNDALKLTHIWYSGIPHFKYPGLFFQLSELHHYYEGLYRVWKMYKNSRYIRHSQKLFQKIVWF